ncbi:uncharacterized protein LOC113239759 [Hyposmocoma kahamanoa]|uniref:uncharacterized protein LOC113239759 n=1 Tax=Hyposmocoma kahamanoa TaxID=1477025 RepID=UPI000E6D8AD8|nr:uncharacterized protein LOC113239759 [Hyposmocoma kahamanoa]
MRQFSILLVFEILVVLSRISYIMGKSVVPVLTLDLKKRTPGNKSQTENLQYLPFIMLIDKSKDTSEYWRETEILSLVRDNELDIDYDRCEQTLPMNTIVKFPSRRTVRPICKSRIDYQLCPQCAHFSNFTECELFRDSCREKRVTPDEQRIYCDRKYGKWRTMFIPADYSQCRCCDECVFYRELDQSCVQDDYSFDAEEFLPVTSIDFRAGCNPYWGHPEQEFRALRCDKVLRRCVPVTIPPLPNETLHVRRSFRYEPTTGGRECPVSCRGYECFGGLVNERQCSLGAFLPDKEQCNCCGRCSSYQHCAREKCRTGSNVECDGYGNYKEAVFTPHVDQWSEKNDEEDENAQQPALMSEEIAVPSSVKTEKII